ncbi:MAG: hypothetical protein V9E83_10465 [Baekduia sp.]
MIPIAVKPMKFPTNAGEHEADAVGREQALDLGRLGPDLVVLGVRVLTGDRAVLVVRGPDVAGLDLRRRRLDDLVGRGRTGPVEHLAEHDDDRDQRQEQHRGVRDLVADPLDAAEEPIPERLLLRCRRCCAHP